ncbi:MAG: hypothetical protein JJD92_07025 [Frankiaceae bacterium]|nr:hypothetical protein [Frankiaceae bacterium]
MRYVVVGGLAVVMSGHVRATVDLDVVVDLDPDAAARAMQALEGLGLQPRVPIAPRDFADPDVREGWIRDKHMQVLSFFDPQHPAREVDVFVSYPLDFETLVAGAVPTRIGDRIVPVAARHHLIEMTRAAGRPVTSTLSSGFSKGTASMSDDPWSRATFAGTEQAQAELIADLTPDERLALLEQLLEIAEASGALQRACEDKQRTLDEAWATALDPT